jgi:2-dehydropantoate 2-reductase
MRSVEKIAIMGAGAIGSSFASIFHDMSKDAVAFIAGEKRHSLLKRYGITVNGIRYDVPVFLPGQSPEPYDLIIVAVKHHHLDAALADLHGSVSEDSMVLSFMNGVESEQSIGTAFGTKKVLYSIVLGIDAVRLGNETTYSNKGRVFFGELRNDVHTERVNRLKELFEKAQINFVIPDDMIRTIWWKFMINVGINQASAALRSSYGRFQDPGEARSLMDDAMREVMLIAQAQCIDLNEGDIKNWHDVLSGLSPEGKTSMLQDVEAGRKTEVEMFAGKVIELGRRFNIPTPVNETLFQTILALEDPR